MDRRAFSAAAAAFAAWPLLGAIPASGAVDVVIVGAGAAGIAAARRLAAAGKRFALLEAANRIGGRCITNTGLFGVPYDLGAHWIHMPKSNPLTHILSSSDVDIYQAPSHERLRIGQRYARRGEMEEFNAAQSRSYRAIKAAGAGGSDMSCAEALPRDLGELQATIEFALGPYDSAKDLADVSAFDFARSEEQGRDSFCREGFGALIEKLAAGLPVQLSTPVTHIDFSGAAGIDVKTAKGALRAQAVIVTPSTGLLAASKIKFKPALPGRHLDALAKLVLGSYDRVALELEGNPLGLRNDDLVYEHASNERTAAMLANVSGTPLCLIDVGGRFGRALADEGGLAMIDFASSWLVDLFGSSIKPAIKRRHATQWNKAPWVLGAFASAAPGNQPARRVLAEPLNNRIWFAGEATDESWWGTVGGAWNSGERAANAVIGQLKG